jgi:hypothetical protein
MAIAPRNVCLWPKADVSGDTPTPFLNTALGCYDPVRASDATVGGVGSKSNL